MPTVSKLAIAPVKGLALVHPQAVELGVHGVAENRRFFLVADDGRHRSGLAFGPLAAIIPDYDAGSERLALRFPDGSVVDGDAAARDGAIDIPWSTSRVIHGHIVPGPFANALSDYTGTHVRLVRALDSEHPQSYPASMVSEASLDELERSADLPGRLDDRRFRMLVTIAGSEAFEEDRWVGREVRVGEVVLRVMLPTPRCQTTTRDPATGERDFDALHAIRELRGLSAERTVDFGVYAAVVTPGRIALGDNVTPT